MHRKSHLLFVPDVSVTVIVATGHAASDSNDVGGDATSEPDEPFQRRLTTPGSRGVTLPAAGGATIINDG